MVKMGGFTKKEENVNVKVEYLDDILILHMAVQCPECKNWFAQQNIVESYCLGSDQIVGAKCGCKRCGHGFIIGKDSKINTDVSFPEFYNKCMQKKIIWE